MPTCSPECSGFVYSITTTTSFINKTAVLPASESFQKPTSILSSQLSCPPLLLSKSLQLPDIEDVDEESTALTSPTIDDSKLTRFSVESEDQCTEGDSILKSLLMTSGLASPVLIGTDALHSTISRTVSKGLCQQLQSNVTSTERIDEPLSASYPNSKKDSLEINQNQTVVASCVTNEPFQKHDNLSIPCLNMSRMVASLSTLSSWSSSASVATRTNTDNPASLSHIVTNFNINRSAKSESNQQQTTQAIPVAVASVQTTSNTKDTTFLGKTKSSIKCASMNTTLNSTQMRQNLTLSKLNMTTTALFEQTAIASQQKPRFRQFQATESDENKEYTPMKVFKQTPV